MPGQFIKYYAAVELKVISRCKDAIDAIGAFMEDLDDMPYHEKLLAAALCIPMLATCREKAEALLEVLSQKLV